MSNSILHKRRISNPTPPSYTDLILGELAINTITGRLFMRDTNDAVIDIGTNVIDVTVNYVTVNGALVPVSMMLNGSLVSELVLHKGIGYTFRIISDPLITGGIVGTDIIFYTQATEGAAHQEYTDTVTHQDYSATIYIPFDAADNFKFGIRDNGSSNAIADSGGDVIYSDTSGGGGDASSSEQLAASDAVFSWNGATDVWETGSNEGLKSSSGKLVLGSVGLQSGSNLITFDSLTTLDNVSIDCGNFN